MTHRCPTCGWRHPARRAAHPDAQLSLLDWYPPLPPPEMRLVMLHHDPDPDGEPRPALLLPGRRVPIPFRTIAAALAAKASLEAATHAR
jgi:hypothetical protein